MKPVQTSRYLAVGASCLFAAPVFAQDGNPVPTSIPTDLPDFRWHLTARPWQPANTPESAWLDAMEKAVRAMVPLQYWNDADPNDVKNGSIIDPYDKKEVQYGTPLFAFNVAFLASKGRAPDIVESAARALDRSTLNISKGKANDHHGEFFASGMVKAIRLLEPFQGKHASITRARLETWKKRMETKRNVFMDLRVKQNWRTFAMKGEWLRQKDGYINDGVTWSEACWKEESEGGQRERFRRDLDKHKLQPHFFFYHDDTADPETFAYNGATTANLLDMLESGYNGPSAGEMRGIISHNLKSSLLMLSASGEAPGGGRTGEHIWDDSIYANSFALMAEAAKRDGDARLAGQYRRAVQLLMKSHSRFQQENGWFSITKNLFHPSLKNRYASWSGIANYEGFTLACCSETLLASKSKIAEQALPSEIGGYAMQLDPEFASVFLNAGGMQAQICTRGETDKYGGVQWHTLGITRFSRAAWDGRLGPGAGHVTPDFSDGVSFSPTFLENGEWKRVCREPKRFEGGFKATFVHPLLTRGVFTIAPVQGQTGPSFSMEITLTPDGALVDTNRVSGEGEFGVIWPLLEFDGRNMLDTGVGETIATTSYPPLNPVKKVLQAEEAKTSGGVEINSDGKGHEGPGFVRFTAAGGSVEWNGLDGGDGGQTAVSIRYSLAGDKDATCQAKLTVNGSTAIGLTFPSTGEWDSWHQLQVPVKLAPGDGNVIRIESSATVCARIDEIRVHPASRATPGTDRQNFIALGQATQIDASAPAVRGGYGDFRPVRSTAAPGAPVETFVYPSSPGDPPAEQVRASFKRDGADFSSILGSVKGTLYIGRTSAGGEGKAIDINADGKDDATFDKTCAFILQLENGRITAVETDKPVAATISGKKLQLKAHTPARL